MIQEPSAFIEEQKQPVVIPEAKPVEEKPKDNESSSHLLDFNNISDKHVIKKANQKILNGYISKVESDKDLDDVQKLIIIKVFEYGYLNF